MGIEERAQLTLKKHQDSVVIVRMKSKDPDEARSGLGTGFVIRSTNTSCLVMTCEHIIRGFDESKHTLCVRFSGQSLEYPAELRHRSTMPDLAIIKVNETTRVYPALKFCDSEDVPVLSEVFLLGYVFLREPKVVLNLYPGVSPGCTSAPPQEVAARCKDVVYTSMGTQGSSGSPVIQGDGVIGVQHGSLIHIMHATSSETINTQLKKWLGIAYDVTRTNEELINELFI